MIGAVIWIGYAVAAVCCIPYFARVLVKWMPLNTPPDMEDYIFAVFLGGMLAVFWPLAFLVVGVAKALKREAEGVVDEELT